MQGRLVSSREALSAGWKAFREYAWVLIAVLIIETVVSLVAGRNRVAHFIFAILISAPLAGGLAVVNLKAVRGQYPAVRDLFGGFRRYIQWMGVYWLNMAIGSIMGIPLAVGAVAVSGVGVLREFYAIPPIFPLDALIKSTRGNPLETAVVLMAAFASIALIIAVLLRYGFAYYEAADGGGIVESFRRSALLTDGIRLKLLGRGIVLGLFMVGGLLVCCVGIIVTLLVFQLAFVYIYTQLRGETEVAVSQSGGPDGAQDLTTWSIGRRMRTAKRPRRDV